MANKIIDLNVHPANLGDIRTSILTEVQFQALNGDSWVLVDGRDITGSALAGITGNNTLPDVRGEFLRGADNGRGVDTGRTLNSSQADATALPNTPFGTSNPGDHSHSYSTTDLNNIGPTNFSWYSPNRGPKSLTSSGGGSHTHTINGGDAETRPRNVAVNYFIKIN